MLNLDRATLLADCTADARRRLHAMLGGRGPVLDAALPHAEAVARALLDAAVGVAPEGGAPLGTGRRDRIRRAVAAGAAASLAVLLADLGPPPP